MLISLLSFSQQSFPKKLVIDRDTVCVISIDQLRLINGVFVDRDECNEVSSLLNSQIRRYEDLVTKQDSLLMSSQRQVTLQEGVIEEKDRWIFNDGVIIKKHDKKIKFLKFQRFGLSVICGGLTTLLLLGKK